MNAKNRSLYLAVLIGLALAVPYIVQLIEGKDAKKHAATGAKPVPAQQQPQQQPPPQPAAPAASPEEARARLAQQQFATIETGDYVAKVTNLNGGLTQFELKGKRFRTSGKPLEMVTTNKESYLPLALDVAGLPQGAPRLFELSQLAPDTVLLSGESGGVRVTRKMQAGKGPYQLCLLYTSPSPRDS